DTLRSLALAYQSSGDTRKALSLLEEALQRTICFWRDNLANVGERQRLGVLDSVRTSLDHFLLFAWEQRLAASDVYPWVLSWKGAVAARQRTEALLRDQPNLQPNLKRLNAVRQQLTQLAFDSPQAADRDAWLHKLDQLREQKEQLESELS